MVSSSTRAPRSAAPELVELLADSSADCALEALYLVAQAPVVLLQELLLDPPSGRGLGAGEGVVGRGAALAPADGLDVLAHAFGVDEPVGDVRGAGHPGEGDRLVVGEQLVD